MVDKIRWRTVVIVLRAKYLAIVTGESLERGGPVSVSVDSMRAVVQHSYGSPDVLELAEVPRPEVADDEVLVKIRSSAVTQGDRRLRAADFPGFVQLFGRLITGVFGPRHPTPGTSFAGVVVAVGDEVERFTSGDRVFGGSSHGAHADYLCVAEESPIVRAPTGVEFDELADAAYGAGTALTFLRDIGEVRPEDHVLVAGAAGGVGRFAVQLAAHEGADVTGVCREEDFEFVREMGADYVIDYETEDWTGREGEWDVILDTSGTLGFGACESALTREGRFLGLVISLSLLFHAAWTWLSGRPRAVAGVAVESREQLEDVRNFLESSAFRPVVDSRYPLEGIHDAHRRLETERPRGSVVVTFPDPPEPTNAPD